MCGSDWAFSSIGSVEGAYGINTGSFVELSTKQLLDCTGSSTSCQGGTITSAFDYLKTNKAMTAADYAYESHYPEKSECLYDESKATTAQVSLYTSAESGDTEMIQRALSH